jgi:hypothetical protein
MFEILWAGSFMHVRHGKVLERMFPQYTTADHWPGSFWMRKIR